MLTGLCIYFRFGAQWRVRKSSEKFTPALKINKTRIIIRHWRQPEERHSYSNKLRFICPRSLFCLHWDGLTRCFAEQMFVVAFIRLTSTTHSKALSGALAGWQARMLQHWLGKDRWSLELADFRTVWEVDQAHKENLYDITQVADKCCHMS